MRKFPLRAAVFAAAITGLAASAPQARASLIIDYSLDGGSTFQNLLSAASGSVVSGGSPTLGFFSVSLLSISSNSPGTPNIAKLLTASLDVVNTSASTQTIEFAFSDTGFTAPTAPPKSAPE